MPVSPRRTTSAAPTPAKAKAKKKPATKKKTMTPVSRARPGEKLLITCAPHVPDYVMKDLAETLHGAFFDDAQVVAVRIDERSGKIYGKLQGMIEVAPYMFAPASMRFSAREE